MSSSARSSSSSNSRTRPLRAEKSQEDAVLELAELVPSLSEVSLSPKCVAIEQSKGALVHRMDVRFQTIQTEDVEREAEQHSQSFRREPLPPRAAAERKTDLGCLPICQSWQLASLMKFLLRLLFESSPSQNV